MLTTKHKIPSKFFNYCFSFYGVGGVYSLHHSTLAGSDGEPYRLDTNDLAVAIRQHMNDCKQGRSPHPFDGDSLDREKVGIILTECFGYVHP
jgi:hypothetical protein